ncbi:beta and beta-prime subunits of dna dependent rna-polymerase [Lasius niger]|uniref:Beta and beta-prime subunits of dna dependent rna-polymerase n=1 Tax=Lasius niger TaxID=67767 RepID=A0A0J7NB07_LASNI|nr:beta and beta-prime subunits of dna dependent rna-polymerase [Lasius niger]
MESIKTDTDKVTIIQLGSVSKNLMSIIDKVWKSRLKVATVSEKCYLEIVELVNQNTVSKSKESQKKFRDQEHKPVNKANSRFRKDNICEGRFPQTDTES